MTKNQMPNAKCQMPIMTKSQMPNTNVLLPRISATSSVRCSALVIESSLVFGIWFLVTQREVNVSKLFKKS
jgi:hypothetical protein